MGREIDLMVNYPKTKRDPGQRAEVKTEEDKRIAREFGREFFDGERKHGYGGFSYQPRFWQPVIPTFQNYYGLTAESSVLDVGCAKGFMLYDMSLLIPGITVQGVDISEYAIDNAVESMKPFVQVANAVELPFPDNSFDVVFSITTLHNLAGDDLSRALKEVMRVSRGKAFITVDGYKNDEEKLRLEQWVLTAKTVMHVNDWKALFDKVGYTGDYYWFVP
jgi:SAM-dependent methyltransferase